jgi:transglutaminase-like putative cysteine protease
MNMRLKVSHTTRYVFEDLGSFGLQQLRKTPKSNDQQSVLTWNTSVIGGHKELSFSDHHNNTVELLSFERGTEELIVKSEGEVQLSDSYGVVGRHRGPSPLWLYGKSTAQTKCGAGAKALVKQIEGETELERMHNLSHVILNAVSYDTSVKDTGRTTEEIIADGKGVCQDHTHVFLACAREMGLPARYVSGYLMLNDRTAQEAMHAWAEAYVDGLGWVGFDVSNGISPDTRYVRVATGLDYADAAPVTGLRMGGQSEALSVEIEVTQQ